MKQPRSDAQKPGRPALTALERARLSSWGLRCKRELRIQKLGPVSTLDLALANFGQVKVGAREPPRYFEGIIKGMCSVPTPKEPMKSIDFVGDLPGMARARDWYQAKFWRAVVHGYIEEPNVSSAIQSALAELGYERMSLEASSSLYRLVPGSDQLVRSKPGQVGRGISFKRSLARFAEDVLRRRRQQGWIELLYVIVLLHVERVLNRDSYGCFALQVFADRLVRGPLARRLLGRHAQGFRTELASRVLGLGAMGAVFPLTLHADPLGSSVVIVPFGFRDGHLGSSFGERLFSGIWGTA